MKTHTKLAMYAIIAVNSGLRLIAAAEYVDNNLVIAALALLLSILAGRIVLFVLSRS